MIPYARSAKMEAGYTKQALHIIVGGTGHMPNERRHSVRLYPAEGIELKAARSAAHNVAHLQADLEKLVQITGRVGAAGPHIIPLISSISEAALGQAQHAHPRPLPQAVGEQKLTQPQTLQP